MIRQSGSPIRLLTDEERAASLQQTLADHPEPGSDIWVFAYGSLIWNPAFHFVEKRFAKIFGFHRRYCMWTTLGRGCPENPGLMLGLDRGGSCKGLVFRIAEDAIQEEMEIIWRREMLAGSYIPTWCRAETEAGQVWAISFVMDRANERYCEGLDEDKLVDVLSTAKGRIGSCAEYLFNTVEHLDAMGLRDQQLSRVAERVRDRIGCA
ncbi:MAG: gamma-glutamylcyclotransferase [Alphaproteobacteria bacterium]|nr:gamma-glutamylcyclotransferase [Alphaproteobacteria bacterium]